MRHSWRPVSCYLAPIILLTVLYNLPRFWELRLGVIPVEGEEGSLIRDNSSQQLQELNNYFLNSELLFCFLIQEIIPTPLRLHPLYIKVNL